MVGGRELVRFDSFVVDGLGERTRTAQLWADPETRLPVRLRERRDPGRRTDDREWIEATFAFPEEGPLGIHDLGVPEGLPVNEPVEVELEPELASVLDGVEAARAGFLTDYRLVLHEPGEDSEIDVFWFRGGYTLKPYPNGGFRQDWSGSQVAFGRWFDHGPEIVEWLGDAYADHDAPEGPLEAIVAWTLATTPVSRQIWDGERDYSLDGLLP